MFKKNRKIGIFGYGSLANRTSLEHSLGHPVSLWQVTCIKHWERKWDVVLNNTYNPHKYHILADGSTPKHVLALNLEPTKVSHNTPNGILVCVTRDELDALDKRESIYDRVDITQDMCDTFDYDVIYTYVGDKTHVTQVPDEIIATSYIQIVENGFKALGAGEYEKFLTTTKPPSVPIIEAAIGEITVAT